jgi:hypothetical protein
MPITKGSGTPILSAVTTSQTSAAITTSADFADSIYAALVVVGTPTSSATWQIFQSPDGGTTYYGGPVYSAALAPGTYQWIIALDPTCTRARVQFNAQAGGGSGTFTAQLNNVVAIGGGPAGSAPGGLNHSIQFNAAGAFDGFVANGDATIDPTTGLVTVAKLGPSGSSHAAGMAPDPGGTAGTARFLREDATWTNTLAMGTITASTTALGITGTFNNSAAAFAAPLMMNITNTAAGPGTYLFDLRVNGSSVHSVMNNGSTWLTPNADVTNVIITRSSAGQTADMTQWRDQTNARLAWINPSGGFTTTANIVAQGTLGGAKLSTNTSQGNLANWDIAGIGAGNTLVLQANSADPGPFLRLQPSGLISTKGASNQTANLFEVHNYADAVEFTIGADGTLYGNGGGLANLNASNLASGTVPAARLPTPSLTTLGGIQAIAPAAHQWVASISTSGVAQLTQPGFADLSGSVAPAQLPALTGVMVTTAGTAATSFAPIPTMTMYANYTTGSAAPQVVSLSGFTDVSYGSVRGSLATRGASSWGILTPIGSTNRPLQSNGVGADLSYNPNLFLPSLGPTKYTAGPIYSCGPCPSVTMSTSGQSILSGGGQNPLGSLTIPANTITIGTMLWWEIHGWWAMSALGSLAMAVALGGSQVLSGIGPAATPAVVAPANQVWYSRKGKIGFWAPGTACNTCGSAEMAFTNGTNPITTLALASPGAFVTINSTVALLFDIQVACTVANAGNTIQVLEFMLFLANN